MPFSLTSQKICPEELKGQLENPAAGAYVSFEGWVRNLNHGKQVRSLEYEAYAPLARKEADKIFSEAREHFDVLEAAAAHRTGHLAIGESAVWVGVVAAHRQEAFQAAQFIMDQIKARLPIWKKEHYAEGPAQWVGCHHCHPAGQSHTATITEEQLYGRQQPLPEVGPGGQRRLKDSKVLVIGLGGLGHPIVLNLGAAGVGRLTLCDLDTVEVSNLHRQPLFTTAHIGQKKVDVAARALQERNPFIQIDKEDDGMNEENALNLIHGHDLVLDATDQWPVKFLIHDACRAKSIPLIQAGLFQWHGELQSFTHGEQQPCLYCLWEGRPPREATGNCQEGGILGATAMAVGSFQASMALHFLLTGVMSCAGQKVLIDTKGLIHHHIRPRWDPSCQVCRQELSPLEKWRATFRGANEIGHQDVLRHGVEKFTFVDIRSKQEVAQDNLELQNIRHLPSPGAEDIKELAEQGGSTIFFCQKGLRSRRLVETFSDASYAASFFSLAGGVGALKKIFNEVQR